MSTPFLSDSVRPQLPEDPTTQSPYEFGEAVFQAREMFDTYQSWADTNPGLVEEHIARHIGHLIRAQEEARLGQRVRRLVGRSKDEQKERNLGEEVTIFSILNLGMTVQADEASRVIDHAKQVTVPFKNSSRHIDPKNPRSIKATLSHAFPEIADSEELDWFQGRIKNLQKILPEFVIRAGGLGKVIRTAAGVMTIASVGARDLDPEQRRELLRRTIGPAYFYGATYPIVDDVLQDSGYIARESDRQKYHEAIAEGLNTGKDIDASGLPDHPLTDEMLAVYRGIREEFPFSHNTDLYHALESMYLSQHNDAKVVPSSIENASDLYAMISVKAGLSRIVANMLARRPMTAQQSWRLSSTLLRNQLLDDARDYRKDLDAEVQTPYTLAIRHPDLPIGNPLMHLFAYEAFVANEIYEGDPRVAHVLSKFSAYEIGKFLSGNDEATADMRDHFGDIDVLAELINTANALPPKLLKPLDRKDKQLEGYFGSVNAQRDPQIIDPRTYISDALGYINDLMEEEFKIEGPVKEVIWYALEAGGKRVRPALTLMLAESLGIDREKITPLLLSLELAHTATLIFDDLPAQDNASLRRGRPTAHKQFEEYDAQLAGISMLSQSLGMLGGLGKHFPAEKVNEVIEYVGTILGADKLCLGQHMDLSMNNDACTDEIIEMYNLKTSSLLAGSLIPLMILAERPENEIKLIDKYAYHAGIIFQLQDDILDATSSSDITGKDSGLDINKKNIVTTLGLEGATALLHQHLAAALRACEQLDFPTGLLENTAKYFASRTK